MGAHLPMDYYKFCRDSLGKSVVNSIVTDSSLECMALCRYEWKLREPNLIIVDLWTLAAKKIGVANSMVLWFSKNNNITWNHCKEQSNVTRTKVGKVSEVPRWLASLIIRSMKVSRAFSPVGVSS